MMTNVKQMTPQWKPFLSSKTLKMDIIYMNLFEENSDLELPLPFKNLRSLCNVRKSMKLEFRQALKRNLFDQKKIQNTAEMNNFSRSLALLLIR